MGMIEFGDFSGGLWLNGPADQAPPNSMRRNRGVHKTRGNSILRSRAGLQFLAAVDFGQRITSMCEFDGGLWLGTDAGKLYEFKNGVVSLVFEGFTANRKLRFSVAPPNENILDALFIANGGTGLKKVLNRADHTRLADLWGIPAPPNGFQVVKGDRKSKSVEPFTHGAVSWVVTAPTLGTVVDAEHADLGIEMVPVTGAVFEITHVLDTPIDLTSFTATAFDPFVLNDKLDYLILDIRASDHNRVEFIQVGLDLGIGADAGMFKTDFAAASIVVNDTDVAAISDPRDNVILTQFGRASGNRIVSYADAQRELKSKGLSPDFLTITQRGLPSGQEALPIFSGAKKLPPKSGQWLSVQVPLANLITNRSGTGGSFAAVTAIRLIVKSRQVDETPADPAPLLKVEFTNIRLEGGYGTSGSYPVQITYFNSLTGNRSNPNSVPVLVDEVDRHPFVLSGLPYTNLPDGVDTVEIWRPLGNQFILVVAAQVKVSELATPLGGLAPGQYFDRAADILAFNLRPGFMEGEGTLIQTEVSSPIVQSSDSADVIVPVGATIKFTGIDGTFLVLNKPGDLIFTLDRPPTSDDAPLNRIFRWRVDDPVLGQVDQTTLSLSNNPPEATFTDAVYHSGRMFWLSGDEGKRGNLYFSPVGLPESIESFATVVNDEEELQKVVKWNDSIWAFSRSKVYELKELEVNGFTFREVYGAPGTHLPESVISTPLGVMYQAADGIRRFDGVTSTLVNQALSPVFRGENVADIGPVNTQAAGVDTQEFMITDGTETLALSLEGGKWRDLGLALDSFFFSPSRTLMLCGRDEKVFVLEPAGQVDDDGTVIPIVWETAAKRGDASQREIIKRFYLDALLSDQSISITAIYEDREEPVGVARGSGREMLEFPVLHPGRIIGIRLSGHLAAPIQVYRIAAEV